jgi:cobalt-zinc-cadmium efflux system membrane fusion protein
LAALAGLGYWGHATGWNFTSSLEYRTPGIPDQQPATSATVRYGPDPARPAGQPPPLDRGVVIEFPSAEAAAKAGIDIAPAWRTTVTEAVAGSGEVGFDPTRVARLSARAGGTAWRVSKVVGDPVRAGELLALVDAAEVGKAKAEFQQALVQAGLRRRLRDTLRQGGTAIAEQRLREAIAAADDAEARLLSAEQALVNLGLPVKAADYRTLSPDDVARRLRRLGVPDTTADRETGTASLLPVIAPFDGVVLSADVVAGEGVEVGKTLFVVADPRRLWLTLHVPQESAGRIAVGQPALFRPDAGGGEFKGRVAWVGSAADEATRTVPVRVEVPNDDGRLRASTLGRGRVVAREVKDAVVVPPEAVQTFHNQPVVFVRHPDYLKPDGPKAFFARAVRTGALDGQNLEVVSGLSAGEVVATKGTGLLLNELNRFTAGR